MKTLTLNKLMNGLTITLVIGLAIIITYTISTYGGVCSSASFTF
jgi:hypothetical protein